ncbi:indolepyruvate ferredoxin oxidoreductase beta subunit [Desulfuromusa kysingii]|uniref:Indolepyruvate ferredoxin oxidoreductase beta subunit n=1 Tax=Desulfuromusa kysingii TaxID=37625 RepID=A0A1H4AMI1_9BACT|nr:2-oxoacid:acceptor oxidoreductase family protein [Desulfuromusa kysingii]SEA37110.1 indolepyruvate ferredoxin oxidoreductase beta subunit [Desulfuromusa kysingii]
MKQQIIVSGIGGQGVLFLTRVIAQVAVNTGIPVLTSETHGMAQRGGTVLSTIKVGNFASPLVRTGQADLGLLLWEANLPVHQSLLKADGKLLLNAENTGEGIRIDAAKIARDLGNAVLLNLVLLGLAVQKQVLFCGIEDCETAIKQLAPARFVEQNLAAFHKGLDSNK